MFPLGKFLFAILAAMAIAVGLVAVASDA